MATHKVSFFACGNGDSVLIETAGTTILTDLHLTQGHADPENDEKPDFAPVIRAACKNDVLDLFVLTHPDKDHVGGIADLFHLGAPEDWDRDPDEGEPKLLIAEIWCSPYAADAAYDTDQSKPILDEIRRRKRLAGTSEGRWDGNRLTIRCADDAQTSGHFGNASWKVLAPTNAEAHIPPPADDRERESCNKTSLGIRWSVDVYGRRNKILLLGDATVEVLERIHDEFLGDPAGDPEALEWDILLAPHHCSRRSLGRVDEKGKDEEFQESEKALKALGCQVGRGYVVSSSRRFGRNGSPPSTHARNRYYRILAGAQSMADVTQADRDRFLVTGGSTTAKPDHIVFDLTLGGPSRRRETKAPVAPAVVSSVGAGGGYG